MDYSRSFGGRGGSSFGRPRAADRRSRRLRLSDVWKNRVGRAVPGESRGAMRHTRPHRRLHDQWITENLAVGKACGVVPPS